MIDDDDSLDLATPKDWHHLAIPTSTTTRLVPPFTMLLHRVLCSGLLLLGATSAFTTEISRTAALTRTARKTTTELPMWSNDDNIDGADRIKSCFPYLLPLLDGDHFGKFIYARIPPLGLVDDVVLGPLEGIYSAIPFGSVIFFLALTLGTRGNTSMSRGVRFNAQQAALIDVALIFPELIGSSVDNVDVPRALMEPCSNFVYYTYMAMIIYSIYSNLSGQKPNQIPWISNAAEMAVGPF